MLKKEELIEIFSCIEEMQKVFNSTEDVLLFLKKLTVFMSTQIPLMGELRQTILDASSKLPTASHRIHDVITATEFATMEIIDSLDRMTGSLEKFADGDALAGKAEIDKLFEEMAVIVNALQFQDITSQKLNHANTILTAISENQQELADKLNEAPDQKAYASLLAGKNKRTPDQSQHEKKRIDFEERTKDRIRQDTISQDDIDAMFR